MNEPAFLAPAEPSKWVDWVVRVGVAVAYLFFGLQKFPSGPDAEWVRFFRDVGLGDWFRYVTGGVEVLGAILVLIPKTALVGFGVLVATMAGAVVIVVFVLHRSMMGLFPGAFLVALTFIAIWHSGNR